MTNYCLCTATVSSNNSPNHQVACIRHSGREIGRLKTLNPGPQPLSIGLRYINCVFFSKCPCPQFAKPNHAFLPQPNKKLQVYNESLAWYIKVKLCQSH